MSDFIFILAIVLLSGVSLGAVATRFGLPKVTGYILAGILLGQSGIGLVSSSILHEFDYISKLALCLMLFNIGSEFHRGLLYFIGRMELGFVCLFSVLSYVCVFIIMFITAYSTNLSWQISLQFAFVISWIALAAAPPTSLMIIRETKAKGVLTETILLFLAFGSILAIVGSQVATSLLPLFSKQQTTSFLSISLSLTYLTYHIIGAVIFGSLIGFFFSYYIFRKNVETEGFMLLLVMIVFGGAGGSILHVNTLIVSLTMGFTVVNSVSFGSALNEELKSKGLIVYIVFFVFAGAHIHLQEQFQQLGWLGVAYLVSRILGLFIAGGFSYWLWKKLVPQHSTKFKNTKWIGLSVLSHAGIAIGIVSTMSNDIPVSAEVKMSVLSSIFVFELLGSVCMQKTLFYVKEGRKKIRKQKQKEQGKLASIYYFLGYSLFSKNQEKKKKVQIGAFLHTVPVVLQNTQTYEEIKTIVQSESQFFYPVTDQQGTYQGVLDVHRLHVKGMHNNTEQWQDCLYYPPTAIVNQTIDEVMTMINWTWYPTLLVVTETNQLKGFVYYKDIVF